MDFYILLVLLSRYMHLLHAVWCMSTLCSLQYDLIATNPFKICPEDPVSAVQCERHLKFIPHR